MQANTHDDRAHAGIRDVMQTGSLAKMCQGASIVCACKRPTTAERQGRLGMRSGEHRWPHKMAARAELCMLLIWCSSACPTQSHSRRVTPSPHNGVNVREHLGNGHMLRRDAPAAAEPTYASNLLAAICSTPLSCIHFCCTAACFPHLGMGRPMQRSCSNSNCPEFWAALLQSLSSWRERLTANRMHCFVL
jgi:hypothetical protein